MSRMDFYTYSKKHGPVKVVCGKALSDDSCFVNVFAISGKNNCDYDRCIASGGKHGIVYSEIDTNGIRDICKSVDIRLINSVIEYLETSESHTTAEVKTDPALPLYSFGLEDSRKTYASAPSPMEVLDRLSDDFVTTLACEKKPATTFSVGDEVEWVSQSKTYEKRKQGIVLAIVPAGRRLCSYP